jgi:hypothetical protein
MKYDLDLRVSDLSQQKQDGYTNIRLKLSQPFDIHYFVFPLIWDGWINGSKIKITQYGFSYEKKDNYNFIGMSPETEYTEAIVIEAIQTKYKRYN